MKTNDRVLFNDGKGNIITGTITRIWPHARQATVTIKSDDSRTFVRLTERVELINH